MNTEILNASVSAEEQLKEYAIKANNSDTVGIIHSAGTKIASTGKKVGKLVSDHPFITLGIITIAIIYALYSQVLPYIANGVEKISEKREKIKEEKRKKLKDDAMDEIINSRYGYSVDDVNKDHKNVIQTLIDYHKR